MGLAHLRIVLPNNQVQIVPALLG